MLVSLQINAHVISRCLETLTGINKDEVEIQQKLAVRLHLLCLLIQDLGTQVAVVIERTNLLGNVAKCLFACKEKFNQPVISESLNKYIFQSN